MPTAKKSGLTISQHEDIANELHAIKEALDAMYRLTLKTYPKGHRINKRLGKLAFSSGDVRTLLSAFDMAFVQEYGVARISPHECDNEKQYLEMRAVQERKDDI